MKLTFINTSKFMIKAFQAVLMLVCLFGLFVVVFVNDTNYEFSVGPLQLKDQVEASQLPGVSISPLDNQLTPNVSIDELILEYPLNGDGIGYFAALMLLILTAGSLYGLEQLKRMIASLESGEPFIRENVWRIYILATLICCIPVLRWIYFFFAKQWIESNFQLTGLLVETNSNNTGIYVLFGTLLITIGKIFEHGIKLKEEQELTV